jgi:hypothetical protein
MAERLLTDAAIRKARPQARPYRLADGANLYLYIAPSGVKSWQVRYRLGDKQQTATLGKYPDIGLKEARDRASDARRIIAEGGHVTIARRVAKMTRHADEARLFKEYAESWVKREAERAKWSPGYVEEVSASIRRHLSTLDPLPLNQLTAPILAPASSTLRAPRVRRLPRASAAAIRLVRERDESALRENFLACDGVNVRDSALRTPRLRRPSPVRLLRQPAPSRPPRRSGHRECDRSA